ncbi:LINE-1 retrotransposable element ORF2 protein [Durusdinium trenchii]|uniref:LINE-1 retrotransposable element ORF2 protein n=2 Tax=Durusdinium trenchii TaxID=1381693 RepID=A0ABP0SM49_9DINO
MMEIEQTIALGYGSCAVAPLALFCLWCYRDELEGVINAIKGTLWLWLTVPVTLVLWLEILWLPIWLANFVAVVVQLIMGILSLQLFGLTLRVLQSFSSKLRSKLRKAMSARSKGPLTLALTAMGSLISAMGLLIGLIAPWVFFTATQVLLIQALQHGWEPPFVLHPLKMQARFLRSNLTPEDIAHLQNLTMPDKVIPKACQAIRTSDLVDNVTAGITCASWCRAVDLYLPSSNYLFWCLKAEAWWAFSPPLAIAFAGFHLAIPISILSAVLYALPAIWVTCRARLRSDQNATAGYENLPLSSSDAPPSLPSADWPLEKPSSTDILSRFAHWMYNNDRDAAIFLAKVAVGFNIFEVVGDVNSSFNLLALGQPFYALAMLASIILPNYPDLFQIGMAQALEKCTQQGMVSEKLLEHQEREGLIEGAISCIIALCALVRTPAMSPFSTASLAFTVCTSIAFSIPSGSTARALLQAKVEGKLNLNDYYQFSKARKDLEPAQKYFISVLVMSSGCALGLMLCAVGDWMQNLSSGPTAFHCMSCWKLVVGFVGCNLLLLRTMFVTKYIVTVLFIIFWILQWIDVVQHSDCLLTCEEWHIRQMIFSVLGTVASLASLWWWQTSSLVTDVMEDYAHAHVVSPSSSSCSSPSSSSSST